ncbi:MAG TPA: T9SS type A sorting domain-containing protein [Caldithrix abyssi]|uniref:T9SS type A sorting domain-containing protein n=1 Tax=Caldithrix abyssi TaxID=187145 RepID=A0A7V1PUT3_CALAY|nr:T9SS type A sorting domain-containing protein [Caldithrix abyssi]
MKVKRCMKTLASAFLILFMAHMAHGQGISIGSGTVFTGGAAIITIPGGWSNSGTFTPLYSTVVLNAAGGTQTISNGNGESFNNLTVNKAAGEIQLLGNVSISGNLTLISGDIDLNGNIIDLGTGGSLSETAGNTVKGASGVIKATRDLNAPNGVDVAGLGAILTSGANLGSTVVERGHAAQTGGGNSGILRYYTISPANNSNLNATMTFSYDDSELNGNTESSLVLFESTDNGASWVQKGGSLNTTDNQITVGQIDAFYRWTAAGSDTPLPVELSLFTATVVSGTTVQLGWKTQSEYNNYGFEVQRKSDARSGEWRKIGFVRGQGNSSAPGEYGFVDENAPPGRVWYRLKQIDTNGRVEYSGVVEVMLTLPDNFELFQNYPNPFNPRTSIKYAIPRGGRVLVKVYDLLGREIVTLVDQYQKTGVYDVSFDASALQSGTYLYSIISGRFRQTKKMLLIK